MKIECREKNIKFVFVSLSPLLVQLKSKLICATGVDAAPKKKHNQFVDSPQLHNHSGAFDFNDSRALPKLFLVELSKVDFNCAARWCRRKVSNG